MSQYQYTLETYSGMSSRYTCPSCEKPRQLTRYIHSETGEPIADNVGRCNREIQCGYHYTPRQYFEDHPSDSFTEKNYKNRKENLTKPDFFTRKGSQNLKKFDYSSFFQIGDAQQTTSPESSIEQSILDKSLANYPQNTFIQYLYTLFDEETVIQLINRYRIGTSKYWKGATVFWQVDQQHRIRSGKIMLYGENGKRVKEPFNHVTWAHKALNLPDFKLQQCLFGEHLLAEEPTKIVAIVESEKTAIIASAYLPKFIWLASGSLNNLTPERCQALTDRPVALFPDLGAFEKWKKKGMQFGFQVSDLLERHADQSRHNQGFDLADYLVKLHFTRVSTFVNCYRDTCTNLINKHGYPASWDT